MSRIPAAHIQSPSGAALGGNAARKVLKRHHLLVEDGPVLIQTWGPQPISETPPADSPAAPAPSESPALASDDLQHALAAQEKNFERRLARETQKAREEGRLEGLSQGRGEAEGLIRDHTAIIEAIATGFDSAWESLAAHSEPLLEELAFRMAEAVLESPLPESVRALSTKALSEAIESMGESRSVQVSVHPADYMMLDESGVLVPLSRNHPNLNWRTDASLDRGDWEARSDAAVVRRVAREMLADLRDRLNHLEA